MATKSGITAEELRRRLSYDPASGEFRWLVRAPGVRFGAVAGNIATQGVRIRIRRIEYYAHRLAWLHVHGRWPAAEIDHINGNPQDNRLANLREATHAQNLSNVKTRTDNTSGQKGVSKTASGKWRATFRGQHIGSFDTFAKAAAAYETAAEQGFGAFRRGAQVGRQRVDSSAGAD